MGRPSILEVEASFEITQKEKLLCEALHGGLPNRVALNHAGYHDTKRSVNEITKKPNVQNYLTYLGAKAKKKVSFTRDQITEGMHEAIQDAKMIGDPMAQIRGWSEIGKINGLYAPEVKKIEVTTSQQQLLDEIDGASQQELLEIAEAPALEGSFEIIED